MEAKHLLIAGLLMGAALIGINHDTAAEGRTGTGAVVATNVTPTVTPDGIGRWSRATGPAAVPVATDITPTPDPDGHARWRLGPDGGAVATDITPTPEPDGHGRWRLGPVATDITPTPTPDGIGRWDRVSTGWWIDDGASTPTPDGIGRWDRATGQAEPINGPSPTLADAGCDRVANYQDGTFAAL